MAEKINSDHSLQNVSVTNLSIPNFNSVFYWKRKFAWIYAPHTPTWHPTLGQRTRLPIFDTQQSDKALSFCSSFIKGHDQKVPLNEKKRVLNLNKIQSTNQNRAENRHFSSTFSNTFKYLGDAIQKAISQKKKNIYIYFFPCEIVF